VVFAYSTQSGHAANSILESSNIEEDLNMEFEQRAARLAEDLHSGNRQDASHILRDEFMSRPAEAVALINAASRGAGPNAREHIVVQRDGDVLLTDPYGSEHVGRLQQPGVNPGYPGNDVPPPQSVNPGYYGNDVPPQSVNPGYYGNDVPPPPPPPSDGSQVAAGVAIGAIGGLILGSILHGDHRRPDDGRHRH
jgi:hypothetical protein